MMMPGIGSGATCGGGTGFGAGAGAGVGAGDGCGARFAMLGIGANDAARSTGGSWGAEGAGVCAASK